MEQTESAAGRRSRGGDTLTAGQRFRREVRGYAEALVVAFLVVTFLFTTLGVVGDSMRPTLSGGSGEPPVSLLTGDRVFIPKYETWLRRLGALGPYGPGEIVVVREPANSPAAQPPARQGCLQGIVGLPCRPFLIKRVIAGPGGRLKLVAGQVYLNGRPLDQAYITGSGEVRPEPQTFPVITQEAGRVTGLGIHLVQAPGGVAYPNLPTQGRPTSIHSVDDPRVQFSYGDVLAALAPLPAGAIEGEPFVHELVVPAGRYFVMGDNRSPGGSDDSRLFGFVPALSIAGRASAVVWPPRRDGSWNWRLLQPPPTFEAAGTP